MPLNSTRGAGSAIGFGFGAAAGWDGITDYLVVAGGGGTGANGSGGGGAGGYRASGYGPAPLQGSSLTLTPGSYPVVVGAGGPFSPDQGTAKGGNSSFNPGPTGITSTGGGSGGPGGAQGAGGGSGGGGSRDIGAPGNNPPVSPPQGNPGKAGDPSSAAAGGGGGGAVSGGPTGTNSQPGGDGAPNSISGSAVSYAGGGGPGGNSGTVNTGGGAGGEGNIGATPNGGSGIVIIRSNDKAKFSVSPGTNTVTTAPNGDKVATFTVSGTLTVG